jgi:hypothetical protein
MNDDDDVRESVQVERELSVTEDAIDRVFNLLFREELNLKS